MKLITPIFTVEQIAQRFGVSVENVKRQYAENAVELEGLHKAAVDTGKKVRGYTAAQLKEAVDFYKNRSI